ncbi:PREDICTED: venom allergen 3-like [Wasmannia auropunctata]|uniref:venom allergen 3-like n=1 Tax=Wasmannia auropunctata TaxID=64793 RepID=UPI0005EEDA42|nr:PREDICTED: venom allergen 3-like [Wasmannia auropunctata]
MAAVASFLYFAIMAEVFATIAATDYCNVKSCTYKKVNVKDHTMCKYTSPNPAAACGQGSTFGLSKVQKDEIVSTHNRLRQKVASGQETRGAPGPQPAAVSMPDLTWDDEIATIAQRWANQCNFDHDKCRDVDRFQVGQNIAEYSTTGKLPSLSKMIKNQWYDEVDKFNGNKMGPYKFDMDTGHYSQMVWADTTKIGCGLAKYKEGVWNVHYLVCNYGPSGNFPGREVYKQK